MPRRSGRSAGSRSGAVATRPNSSPAPTNYKGSQVSTPSQPGLFGQMASTAAGVALGSTIGHTLGAGITSLFTGSQSRSNDIEDEQSGYRAASRQAPSLQQTENPCNKHNQAFLKCIETHSNDIAPCQFYLDAMRQCMASTGNSPYN